MTVARVTLDAEDMTPEQLLDVILFGEAFTDERGRRIDPTRVLVDVDPLTGRTTTSRTDT